MASDGGHANAGPYDNLPGMSVRDEFAKAIVKSGLWPARRDNQSALEYASTLRRHARQVYDGAQLLTDEKLRRDKADRDEGKAG